MKTWAWALAALAAAAWGTGGRAAPAGTPEPANVALYATPATSFVSGHETLGAVNDGFEPQDVGDHRHGAYGNWPRTGTQWVELSWSRPIATRRIAVYWWDDTRGVRLPTASRLLYWDGAAWAPVKDAAGLGVEGGKYNVTDFAEVKTTKLRLEFDGRDKSSTGIIEWKVFDAGTSSKFPPQVIAGPDRVVVLPAATWLQGATRGAAEGVRWSRASGPGDVKFADPSALETTAEFAAPGAYVLKLSAKNGDLEAGSSLNVRVEQAPALPPLESVPTPAWTVDSPLWGPRLKQQVVHWIPHCIAKLSEPGLKEGGIENFVEAAKKLAGQPHKAHFGPPWANAYTFNVVESMCLALQLDAGGDAETEKAQSAIRATLDAWIPMILAAQEPDGYLQTRFTLGTPGENDKPPPRWSRVGDHEGYIAGYFIDAAVAHFRLTSGRDRRMYDAAKKLADCWDANIGPAPKKTWFDGHQAIEIALVRLGRLVNEVEGAGRGDRYVQLARFLLDSRRGGESYDQSHLPVVRQYEALGHAVRAVYNYAAMADLAMTTGDADYRSAVRSLWDNITHKKYYVTGGIGSGETSEGFGADYSLPNNAYCESCSDCGMIFFNHRVNLGWREARCADLVEETLYNAVLGSVDLPAKNFTYTNPLDQGFDRYDWHGCPCCVGNIPRTLLMLPTWTYARSADRLFVNLYVGGTVRVGRVGGTDVEVRQRTEYPWKGAVELEVRPSAPAEFALALRVPDRAVSALYRPEPAAGGMGPVTVNGGAVKPRMENGYAVIARTWKAGDTVRFELPLPVQRVRADERIVADRGRVALRRGPLVYNIESVDQNVEGVLQPSAELTTQWEPDLLGGVVTLRGRFADGSALKAIPNYARNNRGGRSIVWIKER